MNYKSRIKHDPVTAEKYLYRKPGKHEREIKLVERAFSRISDAKTLLDAPCGAGRMSFLAEKFGFETTGVDLGTGILECAEKEKIKLKSKVNFYSENLEALSFSNDQFDASLCFRFFHHLPNSMTKINVIGELTRVSSKYVVISYFSPFSITSIKRKLKEIVNVYSSQHSTRLKELSQYFESFDFTLCYHRYSCPFISTLCIAVYKRK